MKIFWDRQLRDPEVTMGCETEPWSNESSDLDDLGIPPTGNLHMLETSLVCYRFHIPKSTGEGSAFSRAEMFPSKWGSVAGQNDLRPIPSVKLTEILAGTGWKISFN